MPFTFEEKLVLQLYDLQIRSDMIQTLQELLPFIEDDEEINSLLLSILDKLITMTDADYQSIDLTKNTLDAEDINENEV